MNLEDDSIKDKTYKDIELNGLIEEQYENCCFDTVLFYWNMATDANFKNCTFEHCTFAGVAFIGCMFSKCHFINCSFTKSNVGTACSSENSYILDSFIDKQSTIDNPLTIGQSKDQSLLTPQLKKQLYKVFTSDKPKLAVEDPTHCSVCEQTQEDHEKSANLKQITAAYFEKGGGSKSFTANALSYYMPRLLELLLLGEENYWDDFQSNFLNRLTPTDYYKNQFEYYNKSQVNLIIQVLELVYNKYAQQEPTWDYKLEKMTDVSKYEALAEKCKKALGFWGGKCNQ